VTRKLVAALACRNNGTRLYGKPMQRLDKHRTILEQIISSIKLLPVIDEIVLGISEGSDNAIFVEVAQHHRISYIHGDPKDVLMRLVQCGRLSGATDIFRVTTECPWFVHELVKPLWDLHLAEGNDITVCDQYPEGLNFEIYTIESLERSHAKGSAIDRSEFCSTYPRKHPKEFKIRVELPPPSLRRLDQRVTVDNPEDLILCRAIAEHFTNDLPLLSAGKIIAFIDSRPDLQALVQPYVVPEILWNVFD